MKKIYLVLIILLIFTANGFAVGVNVTNPTNTTPNLAAAYPSLASAITALNGITAISGPVTLTCVAGAETAPSGGYTISFTAVTTFTNHVIISGTTTTTITASGALTAGALNDAIFKIIGSDYVTIENFTMRENPANSNTTAGTNNMTEWGVALLHASVTDGAQNNTIQNNIISLDRSYTNTFAIYSNARHSATSVTVTQDITNNTTGPNSGNHVFSNTISNVNMGIAFIGSGTAANMDHGNYIGGSAGFGNTISNWGGAAATSGYVSNSGTSYCIYYNHQLDEKIAYNTITSALVSGTSVSFRGIFRDYTVNPPTGAFVSSINFNTITMSSAFTSGTFEAIRSQGVTAASTGTMAIDGNTIINCSISGAASSSTLVGIVNSSVANTLTMNNNIIKGNTSTATTGGFTGISNTAAVVTLVTMNNNQLGSGGIDPITYSVATSGAINGISNSAAATTATVNINNNTVDGITIVNSGTINGILNGGLSVGTIINMTGNSVLNTTISGAGSNGNYAALSNTSSGSSLSITGNIVRGNVSAATAGNFYGISNTGTLSTSTDITDNQVGNTSGGAITFSSVTTGLIYGIYNSTFTSTVTINLNNNRIDGITAVNSGQIAGILSVTTGTTINMNYDTVVNTQITGAGASTNLFCIFNSATASALSMSNNIISGHTSTATTGGFSGIRNFGTTATSIDINNNQVGVAGSGAVTFSAATNQQVNAIYNVTASVNPAVNINFNSVDGFSVVTIASGTTLVLNSMTSSIVNMNNNQLGTVTGTLITFTGAQSGNFFCIYNGSSAATTSSSIQNNNITGVVRSVTASCTENYIYNGVPTPSNTISNNTFTNLTANTTGAVTFITRFNAMSSGASATCSNNSIVTAFNKTAAGGVVSFLSALGASANGSTITETGNNFSNVTVAGNTTITGWNDIEGVNITTGPVKTITGNTFSNISSGTGSITVMLIDKGAATNCSSNTFSNITGSATLNGIFIGLINGQGNIDCSSNSFTTFSSSGGTVTAISANCPGVAQLNISSNIINDLSSAGAGSSITGINITSASAVNINDNLIHNVDGTGTGSVFATGIALFAGTTVNIYKNKVYDFQETGPGSGGPVINGIRITDGTTVTVYNNFVSDLRGTTISHPRGVSGIVVSSATTSTTYNLYYNSVYLNSTSSGANFGTAGIYHVDNATPTTGALTMINNIVVNMTTPTGTSAAVAYYTNGTTLANYSAASDNNLFYAGIPGPKHLIFYDGTNSDQTLAAYQTRVSTRDANSISVMPNFVSTTDLHLTTANCRIDGRGIPVAGITTDIDAQTRDVNTPDMGADEFTAALNTSLVSSSVCDDRTVSVTGTTYSSNACDLIARVLPSGGAAVAGKVNVCATLDATQQTFNGEPYVQRHFDIEPTTSNQATTSATVTLYFTDAEFVLYNTTNPVVWPRLPTVAGGANADANRANLKVTQFHGAATTSPSSPGNYPGVRVLIDPLDADVFWNGSYWAVSFDVAGFSGFYVHTNNFNAPLPIVVNYLTGHKQGSNHLLNWKVTCTSTPKATMTLERSSDGRNYSGIYNITADAARCQQPFDYADADPLKGMNYYRLKIVDADGHVTYSTTVALLNAVKGFDIVSIAPNPVVSNNFKLNVASAQSGKMEFVIFDMQGRLVTSQSISLIAGFNSMPVNVANLAPGTYTIKGSMDDDQSKVIRFVKQ